MARPPRSPQRKVSSARKIPSHFFRKQNGDEYVTSLMCSVPACGVGWPPGEESRGAHACPGLHPPSTSTSHIQVNFEALGRSFHFSLVPRGPALTSSSVVVIRGENSTKVVAPPAQDSCLYWGESLGQDGQERVALNFCGGFVSCHICRCP